MMARQRQIEAATHAVTRNRRQDRGRELIDGVHERLAHPGEFERRRSVQRRNFRQICPGGKKPVVSGHDERSPVFAQCVDQFL